MEAIDLLIDLASEAADHPDLLRRLRALAFTEQLSVIDDPARHKAIHCTRRAAKSFTAGLYMVQTTLQYAACNVLFIGLTRQSALDIIKKDVLDVILRKMDMEIGRDYEFNSVSLDYTFKNGSIIRITGIDVSEDEMNKLLGKKYRLVCPDEGSLYTVNLRHLVYDILGPAMADDQGTIAIFGTSSNFTQGLFFDITNGKEPGWSVHRWSAHQNPHIDWQAQLDDIKLNRPLYMETPQFRQWYLNEWVIETDKLVYRFSPDRNLFRDLPHPDSKGWTYILSCDLGWEDDTAIVLSAYHEHEPTFYVLECFKQKHMTFDAVEKKLQGYISDPRKPVNSVIIDGANKQGVETMTQRSNIHFEYADKLGKTDHIEICNGDMIQGRVKFHESNARGLIDEMMALVWKTDGDKIILPRKEHPSLPNHACFVAGTLVATDSGNVPIEFLHVGNLVRTRTGLRRIIAAGSRPAVDVLKLYFSNGRNVICTVDHPFWTENRGWVCAEELTWADRLFPIEALPSIVIPAQKDRPIETTLRAFFSDAASICTVSFMKMNTAPYPWGITCTTWMETHQTTIQTTWKQLTLRLMRLGMTYLREAAALKCSSTWIEFVHSLKNGIARLRAALGIVNTRILGFPKRIKLQPKLTTQKSRPGAEILASTISSAPVNGAKTNSEPISTAKLDAAVYLVARRIAGEKKTVYNLTVEEDHEYFANGILVSNCDAFLYGWFNGWHFLSKPPKVVHKAGTPEYIAEQEELHKDALREKIQREQALKAGGDMQTFFPKGNSGLDPWHEW